MSLEVPRFIGWQTPRYLRPEGREESRLRLAARRAWRDAEFLAPASLLDDAADDLTAGLPLLRSARCRGDA